MSFKKPHIYSMARKKENALIQLWSSFSVITKLFVVTAVVAIFVTNFFIQYPQNFQQEAARGGNSKYTITLLTTYPVFAGSAYFNVTGGNISTGEMWLLNSCNQNSTVVYQQYLKIAPDGNSGPFTLGPTPSWSGDGAECSATVKLFRNGSFRSQGTITYTVAP